MRRIRALFSISLLLFGWVCPVVAESWETSLAQMPLACAVPQLNRTNCVQLVLGSFQSNATVKAIVFMPGATDEFYMFRRATATLTNPAPSLLDAVMALTNQTFIRATWQDPILLLHTSEDPLKPDIAVEHAPTAEKLRKRRFITPVCYNDRDWDYLQPLLSWKLGVHVRPGRKLKDSWHFYRHSFAGCNLTGWEALQCVAFAGKSKFTARRNELIFEPDRRVLAPPPLEHFPK